MNLQFIFMLTQNDRTVIDAAIHLQTALQLGVNHIGFKDIGLPMVQLKRLNQSIQKGRAKSYLEVVSLDAGSEVASARTAIEMGVNYLLGGTRVEAVLPIIENSGINYYPFAGLIKGHPSDLCGPLDDIVSNAKELTAYEGVHGLDLLAYRWTQGNVPELMAAVCSAISKPVIMAGSIGSPRQVQAIHRSGAAAFTIGTAAIAGTFTAEASDLSTQLSAIQETVRVTNTGQTMPANQRQDFPVA